MQNWILTITGIIVGIPALWIVYRTIKGPARQAPTVWTELPRAATSGCHVVFAVSAPLDERAPRDVGELGAISIAATGDPVGLVLDPGTYWIYAVPSREGVGMIEAVDTVMRAINQSPHVIVTFEAQPVVVG